jgi:YjbE family integral membrane protein
MSTTDILQTLTTTHGLTVLLQVAMIDLVLAGDNAIVIGLAASGLEAKLRGRAIMIGIIAATVLRIAFAAFTIELLEIVGLLLAGGILLLWVGWKMWRELRNSRHARSAEVAGGGTLAPKTLWQAAWQIIVADVSMSLDNVLAVAGVARDHPYILAIGLVLSVALMGVASTYVARLLDRLFWLAWVGLGIITFVALRMIWDGSAQIMHQTAMLNLLG